MAASLGPGHAQAVARAGTLKTSTYCWMKRRECKNDFIAAFLSPQCDQICFLKLFCSGELGLVQSDVGRQPLHPDGDQHIILIGLLFNFC